MFPFCQQNKTKTKKLKKTLFESGFHKVDTGFFFTSFLSETFDKFNWNKYYKTIIFALEKKTLLTRHFYAYH